MTWDVPPRDDPPRNARHNVPLGNKARIQLDAIVEVIDEETGASEQFVLIVPCRAEWVYAEKQLFQIPSRDYRNIYSLTEERRMGRAITYGGESHRGHPVSDTFQSLEIDIVRFPRGRVLDTPAAVNEATGNNVPLVGRTQIREEARRKRYVLEYPIKTMNFRPENSSFQVDTGPLLVPDFDSGEAKTIDRLEMAHVVYTRLDYAEFILRRPTPINDEQGRELTRVLHLLGSSRVSRGDGDPDGRERVIASARGSPSCRAARTPDRFIASDAGWLLLHPASKRSFYWLALHLIPGLGARNALKLVRSFWKPSGRFSTLR